MSVPTPGPWTMGYAKIGAGTVEQFRRVEGQEGAAIVVGAPDHPPNHDDPGGIYTVALTGTVLDADAATSEANARLIAAAPDLLEALKACVRRLDTIGEHFPDAIDGVSGMVIGDAREAIAKATGQEATR